MTHTPTPWFTTGSLIGKTTDSGGYEIGYVSELAVGPDEAEANAAFIVRAVNAYDAMLAALRLSYDLIASEFSSEEAAALDGHPIDKTARKAWDAICAAIALAEKQP